MFLLRKHVRLTCGFNKLMMMTTTTYVTTVNYQWFSPTVPGRGLPTRHCFRSMSTSIVRRQYTCVIQRTRLGDRFFAVAGPHLWNSLLVVGLLRHINLSIRLFRSALKTHLFN